MSAYQALLLQQCWWPTLAGSTRQVLLGPLRAYESSQVASSTLEAEV